MGGNAIQEIFLQPGLELVLEPDCWVTVHDLFVMAGFAAMAYPHETVVCRSFLPGVDLCVRAHCGMCTDLGPLERGWAQVQAGLDAWLEQWPAGGEHALSVAGLDWRFTLGGPAVSGIVTFIRNWMRTR